MRSPPPLHNEAELRAYDRQQAAQQYSYDLTARLTYFVVSAEMVVCGYILLNAEKFGGAGFSRWIYLSGGVAALSGVLWRALYNESFHALVHGMTLKNYASKLQSFFYLAYVGISFLFFGLMIWGGYSHLSDTPVPKSVDSPQTVVELPVKPEKEKPSQAPQGNKLMQSPAAMAN
jgi:hypothetical protein